MSYSQYNHTTANQTKLRTPKDYAPISGMCTVCTENCPGPCEIGQSALKGSEVLYPTERATSQAASDKNYPVDFSHLNINGRCFGMERTKQGKLAYCYADLSCEIGSGKEKIRLKAPYIFPAIAKLNWKGYYSGAALAGVMAVIGEDMPTTDPQAVVRNGKVESLPMLKEMHEAFYRYNKGYGALFLQANPDDDRLRLLEYAVNVVGFEAVELKMAQAAKGIQGMGKVSSLEKAMDLKSKGYEVFPDPENPDVQKDYQNGTGEAFYKIGRLTDWKDEWLIKRVKSLRQMGAKYVSVKTGPFRIEDTARLIVMASKADVDLVTVDTAGGGTGNSPIRMMNEWGYPAVYMQSIINKICRKMQDRSFKIPSIAIAGGFASEDQVFKGLALGSPFVNIIGMGRAPMAAAMVGNTAELKITTTETEPNELTPLKKIYGDKSSEIPAGGLGVYQYIQKTNIGLQQLMALCRKYNVEAINQEDLIPLTKMAAELTGLPWTEDSDAWKEVDRILDEG